MRRKRLFCWTICWKKWNLCNTLFPKGSRPHVRMCFVWVGLDSVWLIGTSSTVMILNARRSTVIWIHLLRKPEIWSSYRRPKYNATLLNVRYICWYLSCKVWSSTRMKACVRAHGLKKKKPASLAKMKPLSNPWVAADWPIWMTDWETICLRLPTRIQHWAIYFGYIIRSVTDLINRKKQIKTLTTNDHGAEPATWWVIPSKIVPWTSYSWAATCMANREGRTNPLARNYICRARSLE